HAARLRRGASGWYWGVGASQPSRVEIIERSAHPDAAPVLASIEVPWSASLRVVGDHLAVVSMEYVDGESWQKSWRTTVQIFDVSDPTHPAPRGSLETREILPGDGYYGYDEGGDIDGSMPPRAGMAAECVGCRGGWYGASPEFYEV